LQLLVKKTQKNTDCEKSWEKVRTTKITTSKTKKNIKKFANHYYIENGFLVDHYIKIDKDHYYKNQNIEKNVKRTSKISVLSDFHILTTYGVSTYGVLAKKINF
jgi:hypothetical protein